MSNRRSPTSFGFVNWPTPTMDRQPPDMYNNPPTSGIYDTKEGGMECWFIITLAAKSESSLNDEFNGSDPYPKSVLDVALTDFNIGILGYNATTTPWLEREWWRTQQENTLFTLKQQKQNRLPKYLGSGTTTFPLMIDGAVCVGSTGMSLWDCATESYWTPKPRTNDFNPSGNHLFELIDYLYGYGTVQVAMLLDT